MRHPPREGQCTGYTRVLKQVSKDGGHWCSSTLVVREVSLAYLARASAGEEVVGAWCSAKPNS